MEVNSWLFVRVALLSLIASGVAYALAVRARSGMRLVYFSTRWWKRPVTIVSNLLLWMCLAATAAAIWTWE